MTDDTISASIPAAPADTVTNPQAPAAPEPKPAEPQAEPVAQQGEPATTDDAAASDPNEPGDDPADEPAPKKKGGFQRKIDQLTREKYEERLRRESLEQELTQFRKQSPDSLDAEPGPEPKLENFGEVDQFTKAHAEWAKRTGYQQAIREAEAKTAKDNSRQVAASLAAKEDNARQKYPDYQQAIEPVAPLIMRDPIMKQFMIDSDHGADVAYALAKDPVKFSELAQLSPLNRVRELIKLEARITAPPPPKPVTKAPEPIKPVGSSEKAAFDPETAPMEAYSKWRREQRRKSKG